MLAAGYVVYQLIIDASYAQVGGPFRFLTIWALLFSFFCASRMIARGEGRTARRWDAVVATTAVLNAMVVYLYWKLVFDDPALVRNRELPWFQEYYLHALGPLLQWIDAIFIHRAFRRIWPSLVVLASVFLAYVVWVEAVVGPLNDVPIGSVTTGYPYPFLNNLEFAGRAAFYGQAAVGAFVLMGVFFALGWLVNRSLRSGGKQRS
ncbi:MAG: hypothetical protein AAFN59_07295 [Pseudomonadota bacterium]